MAGETIPYPIPDGRYFGEWQGHDLSFVYGGKVVTAHTSIGVRGIYVKVSFYVQNRKVVERSIAPIDGAEPNKWEYEDQLPDDYDCANNFERSKIVDGVRMFPMETNAIAVIKAMQQEEPHIYFLDGSSMTGHEAWKKCLQVVLERLQ